MLHTFYKVKGWKQCLCKVVALGSERDMKAAMHEMHVAENDGGAGELPPKKKARTEPVKKKKDSSGKENCTPHSGQGKDTTNKGSIIIVSGDSGTPSKKPRDLPEQSYTAITLEVTNSSSIAQTRTQANATAPLELVHM